MSVIMLLRLAIGAKLITLPRFTPDSYVKVLEQNKVSKVYRNVVYNTEINNSIKTYLI